MYYICHVHLVAYYLVEPMPNIISYFTQSSVDGYFLGEMFDF